MPDNYTEVLPGPNPPSENHLCKNCHIRPILEGYPTQLCAECRQQFIKYPIPKWIWLFAGGIAIVMIAGLLRMPKYLGASMHLARAQKAEDARRYRTAQKELEGVVATFPNDVEANGRLLVASAYNLDQATAFKAYAQVENKKIEDEDLLAEMTAATKFLEQFAPQDTLLAEKTTAIAKDPQALESFYAQADSSEADAAMVGYLVADKLYDLKLYDRCDAILQKVLAKEPESYIALTLMAATKRSLGDYDGALAVCDHLLERNREDVRVIAAKARTELKRKHDADGMKYAAEAMKINDKDLSAMEAMAMADFYTGHGADSRRLLAQIQRAEVAYGDSTVSMRLSGLLDGTDPFR